MIITHAFLRPDFIEIQYHTFKKFMLDDYCFVVFNDARDPKIRDQINQTCATYNLPCIQISQEIHDRPYLQRNPYDNYNEPSARSANVIQYSLDILGFYHDGIVMIIDSDMFLIREFSAINYLENYDLAAHAQTRGDCNQINYVWNGLLFFNMNTLPNKHTLNFNCGSVEGVLTDTGGYTYYYFKNNPEVRLKYLDGLVYLDQMVCDECKNNNTSACTHHIQKMNILGFSNPLMTLAQTNCQSIMEIFLHNTFLHYRAGGNWNNESEAYHKRKTMLLNNFISTLLETTH